MPPRTRPRALVISLVVVSAASVGACGSRGPLDIEIIEGIDSDSGLVDAASFVDATDSAAGDAHADAAKDAGHEATAIDCFQCLQQQCGTSLITCITSTPCRTTLQCAAQKCFAGGAPDPQCVFNCAGSDPSGIGPLLAVVQCVTQKCGSDCTSVLGGLGGLGGGGGGGGGGWGGGGGGGGGGGRGDGG